MCMKVLQTEVRGSDNKHHVHTTVEKPTSIMSLLKCPNEILLEIAEYAELDFISFFFLLQTNRFFYRLLARKFLDFVKRGGYWIVALYFAATYGDEELIRLLLENGAEVTITDGNDVIILQAPCETSSIEHAINVLLRQGAKSEIWDNKSNESVVHWAIGRDEEILKLLLKCGANVNTKNGQEGRTPLQKVMDPRSSYIDRDLVKLLLQNGADVNCTDSFTPMPFCYLNGTPLHYAALDPDEEDIIRILLEYGADRSIKNQGGHTPFDLLLQADDKDSYVEILKLLDPCRDDYPPDPETY